LWFLQSKKKFKRLGKIIKQLFHFLFFNLRAKTAAMATATTKTATVVAMVAVLF